MAGEQVLTVEAAAGYGGVGFKHQRLDDQAGGGRARVLLLAGDEKAVADGVRLEARGDDEVRALKLLCLVLDPEGLDPLSDALVDVVLFGVREAGPGLPFDEQAAVREPRLQKRAGGVADDGGGLAGLVEVSDQCVHGVILVKTCTSSPARRPPEGPRTRRPGRRRAASTPPPVSCARVS